MLAAVATGSDTMPSTEPGPVAGTFEHAGPNTSAFVVIPLPAGAAAELDDIGELGAGALLLLLPLPDPLSEPLLQAAIERAAAAAIPSPATRRRLLTGNQLHSRPEGAGHQ
ncbi:hypothetical protein GCM10009754_84820 [Amycolatopsis minnesotensis]|uniref:Uncharacterized protein n=1 Tax=Amycolatopsis minnesotensis TaxID=337894 RepID=A0ABN2SWM8_9PSEU